MEEILYPAMEDHVLDLIIGEGPSARSIRIDLAPFTLVGATTRAGLLTTPLRDRFGIPIRLEFYTHAELELIARAAPGAQDGASPRKAPPRSPSRPRHAARRRPPAAPGARFRRRRRADVDREVADRALPQLDVDSEGLDALDRRYLA